MADESPMGLGARMKDHPVYLTLILFGGLGIPGVLLNRCLVQERTPPLPQVRAVGQVIPFQYPPVVVAQKDRLGDMARNSWPTGGCWTEVAKRRSIEYVPCGEDPLRAKVLAFDGEDCWRFEQSGVVEIVNDGPTTLTQVRVELPVKGEFRLEAIDGSKDGKFDQVVPIGELRSKASVKVTWWATFPYYGVAGKTSVTYFEGSTPVVYPKSDGKHTDEPIPWWCFLIPLVVLGVLGYIYDKGQRKGVEVGVRWARLHPVPESEPATRPE